jgi:hypothetical protein
MFPLYDNTRRQICMAAFLGLCVLPTLTIAGWGLVRRSPWHKQAEEQRLGQELGLEVSIVSMQHTLPGVVRYAGLKLTDPETGQEVFHCSELAATWTSMTDSRGQARPAVVLAATQAESPAEAWQRLHDVLRRRLECQTGRPEVEIRVTADQWTLRGDRETQVLHDVEGEVGLVSNGVQAHLAFRLPGVDSAQPVRMWIARNRQVSPPRNGFNLDTGPNRVPCRLLAACLKDAAALGHGSCFAGKVSAFDTPGGWSGKLSGQLTGVDLGSLAGESSAAVLTGTADVTIAKAEFEYGRIGEVTGRIECGRGSIGRGTLTALHLRPSPQVPLSDVSPAFDRLGLDFRIDSRGISITGDCADVPGAVAVAGGRAVLSEPVTQPQPVAALIQALVPADEVPVPATRQSGVLARLLPIPDAR